ncbi:NOL1/NOP2/Sun family protein [Cavenderia fasciculata]|uniref:NOL1/NOP2/Sun family protein n=1 Tax=Cavenderia fasciculata TaxID=261658 RepID=F4PKW6_CACFS|nr:NOL1/NOP2/Sun family protein [Cavenderia fasciculata]EGG23188.1 NOL1/NOP2/Sun family protein [Cavenderia fasciculata]|eukprot:XP_004361039.1 NOL1/NOP2/Sun family protein [Cavenderia fasciculata]
MGVLKFIRDNYYISIFYFFFIFIYIFIMGIDKKFLAKKAPSTASASAGARKLVGSAGAKPAAKATAVVATKKPVIAASKKSNIEQPKKKVAVVQQEESESEEDDEEFVSAEEDIPSDEEDETTEKNQLFEDSDDEKLNSNTKAFSDSNKGWLKPSKRDKDGDDESEEEEEKLTAFEKKSINAAKKRKQIEEDNTIDIQNQMAIDREQRDETSSEQEEDESEEESDEDNVLPSGEKIEEEQVLGVDLQEVYQRIKDIINTLDNFSKERKKGMSREDYMTRLRDDLATYFGYNTFLIEVFLKLFRVSECLEFLEANETQRPLTIRTNTLKARRKDLADALGGRGVHLEPIKWSPVGLTIYDTQVAIGATPEYLAGHYIQQSASSFLPVVALEPQPGERILDLCASPGGKTTYVAALMKNTGTLVANDINEERMRSLVANIHRLGVKNTIVSNLDGREYPKTMGGFDRCLVDAPCVGLGVIAKDQQIKLSKSQRDVDLCVNMQKELILHAIDSVDAKSPTGGIIVYSTCSLTVEENEGVVDYALRNRDVILLDTGVEFGVQGFTAYRHHRFHPSVALTKRYYPHTHNMDGFYVAKFKKISNEIKTKKAQEQENDQEDEQDYEDDEEEEVESGSEDQEGESTSSSNELEELTPQKIVKKQKRDNTPKINSHEAKIKKIQQEKQQSLQQKTKTSGKNKYNKKPTQPKNNNKKKVVTKK